MLAAMPAEASAALHVKGAAPPPVKAGPKGGAPVGAWNGELEASISSTEAAAAETQSLVAMAPRAREMGPQKVSALAAKVDVAAAHLNERIAASRGFLQTKFAEIGGVESTNQDAVCLRQELARMAQRIHQAGVVANSATAFVKEEAKNATAAEGISSEPPAPDGSTPKTSAAAAPPSRVVLPKHASAPMPTVVAPPKRPMPPAESVPEHEHALTRATPKVKAPSVDGGSGSSEDRVVEAVHMLDKLAGELPDMEAAVQGAKRAASSSSPSEGGRKFAQQASLAVKAAKDGLLAACEILEGLMRQGNLPPSAFRLGPRTVELDARISRSMAEAAQLHKVAYEHETRQSEALRTEIGKAIRASMAQRGLGRATAEELLDATGVGGGKRLSREEFVQLVARSDAAIPASRANALFEYLDDDRRGSLGKEEITRCLHVFYKVVNTSMLSDSFNFAEGGQLGTLQPGEILEVLQGPTRESSVGAWRVRGHVLGNDTLGWATVAGSDGTPFLAQCPVYVKVTVATALAASASACDGATGFLVRKLREGELLEVLLWEGSTRTGVDASAPTRRAKVKAVEDSAVGWATTFAKGRTHLEIM